MTQIWDYPGPITKINHKNGSKPSGAHKIGRVLACLIMLCLVTGIGQAYSLDDAADTSKGVQITTRLYLCAGDENGGSSRGSGGGDSPTAALLWTYAFPDAVTTIGMPTDGSAVAFGTAGGEIGLLNSSGTLLWTHQSGAPVTGVGITAGGSTIAAGAGDRVMMLDAGGRVLWSMGAGSKVLGVGISPDGKYCVAGTEAGDVLLINSRGGLLRKISLGSAVTAVAVGSDGAFVAAGTDDGSIHLLNFRGDVLWTYDAGSAVQSVSIADGGSAVAGTAGSKVFLLDNAGEGGPVWMSDGPICTVRLDPHGSVIGAGTDGGYAHLLSSAGARIWEYGKVRSPEGENSAVTAVAFSSPADYLAVGSDNGNVYYFSFSSRTPPTVLPEPQTVAPEPAQTATAVLREQAASRAAAAAEGMTPQEAPGFSAAVGLGAVAIVAALRRKN
ncbi:WD40 repeat domain-containing protein [Methanoculleus sp. 7T]|uniref:WD40 repeat domain-containing protein n=1 Tax=Methanoculleus sp. 7T TaxID=2937282 RepID=UPI0020BEB940|nr:PQQ-binding-like beta-propeller repeat protein [Methanoculleus sp. 7T]MCK8519196.1 PQQ-binding-like beta-propeller repeat protein [Methanoculleus sp. 7T]